MKMIDLLEEQATEKDVILGESTFNN